jgi:hypothetical protein
MPTNLLEAYVAITVEEKKAKDGMEKVERHVKKGLKTVEEEAKNAEKKVSEHMGKMGDHAELLEHTLKHSGKMFKEFFAGGPELIAMSLAMEGLMSAGEQLYDAATGGEKLADAIKEVAESMKDIRKEVTNSIPVYDRLTRDAEATLAGPVTQEQGKKMMEEIDKQMDALDERRHKTMEALGKNSEEANIEAARQTPEGKALYEKFQAQAKKEYESTHADKFGPMEAQHKQFEIENRAKELMKGHVSDVLGLNPTEQGNYERLKKLRDEVLKKTGINPELYDKERNQFSETPKGGGVSGLEDYSRKIQEGILGGDKPASEKGQEKQVAILEKIESKVGGPARWA